MRKHMESTHSLCDGEQGSVPRSGVLTTRDYLILLALISTAAFIAVTTLVGFRSIVDDVFYVYGANQWLIDPPHLGNTHWELRLPANNGHSGK